MTTQTKLQNALELRIAQTTSELEALRNVRINTKHNTLSNRAISSLDTNVHAKIDDYIGIGKALFVYYSEPTEDAGRTRRAERDITAYSYDNPDGTEIGTVGCMRTSRTITPTELQARLDDVLRSLIKSIENMQADLARVNDIATKWDELQAQQNELLEGVTWATRAVLR